MPLQHLRIYADASKPLCEARKIESIYVSRCDEARLWKLSVKLCTDKLTSFKKEKKKKKNLFRAVYGAIPRATHSAFVDLETLSKDGVKIKGGAKAYASAKYSPRG